MVGKFYQVTWIESEDVLKTFICYHNGMGEKKHLLSGLCR